MNCLRCGLSMQSGLAIIKEGPRFLSLLGGVGLNCFQHLWFVSPDLADAKAVRAATMDGSGDVVLKVGQKRSAERCKGCGLVVLLPNEAG